MQTGTQGSAGQPAPAKETKKEREEELKIERVEDRANPTADSELDPGTGG